MSLINFDSTPFNDSLIGSMNQLITQPQLVTGEEDITISLQGGKKAKPKAKPKSKPKAKPKVKPTESKPKTKLIDTFKKPELEKIASRYDVSLKTRDGKIKTKEQLFNSLKRKDLI